MQTFMAGMEVDQNTILRNLVLAGWDRFLPPFPPPLPLQAAPALFVSLQAAVAWDLYPSQLLPLQIAVPFHILFLPGCFIAYLKCILSLLPDVKCCRATSSAKTQFV